jgi:hypothetical protein
MYGQLSRVQAPIEAYDAMHAEIGRRAGVKAEGLLVHVGRATADGFEVLEVWESREHFERYMREVILPVMADLMPGAPPPEPGQGPQEFDVRGLVIPASGLYV